MQIELRNCQISIATILIRIVLGNIWGEIRKLRIAIEQHHEAGEEG